MAFEPTVVVESDLNPVPRANMTFTTVPDGTVTATVFRTVDGVSTPVRGAISVFAAGGFSAQDTEIPPLVAVSYSAQLFDAAGFALGYTDETEVYLDDDRTIFHNPLAPTTGVVVDPLPSFAADLSAPFDGEVVQPLGGGAPVWIGFGRTKLRGVNLDIATDTDEQSVQFASLFGSPGFELPPIVCIRTDPKWGLPSPLFAVISAPRVQRFNVEFGGQIRYWSLTGVEVRPPAPGISAAGLTYLDMETFYEDYDTIEAAYLTYLDAESDFSLAGLAS